MEQTPDTSALNVSKTQRPAIIRRLYDWVLHWAETPYGTPALFILSFTESSFFPIPPDVLQIALSLSKPKRAFFYATVSGIGSVLGAVLGWYIGFALWATCGGFFEAYVPGCSAENFAKVSALYQEWEFLALFGAAFTPIPFKVFTISAGIFGISLPCLIMASAVGRFARFYIVAVCIFCFGNTVKDFLNKYFGIVSLILFALIVLGFVSIKYMI